MFEQYRRDRDAAALARVIETYDALVRSVCRRYLRLPADVEDAVQETFLKLTRHATQISRDSPAAWLAATAHAVSVNFIRTAVRERHRRTELAQINSPDLQHHLLHESIRTRLHEAMLELDEGSRQWIVARFFRKEPLRVIAGRAGVSVPTMSRRLTATLQDLAAVLRDMGLGAVDELTLAEHFGDPLNIDASGTFERDEPLRFAPDWRTVGAIAPPTLPVPSEAVLTPATTFLPGWSRPIRVGVMVSYLSLITDVRGGMRQELHRQAESTHWLVHPGFRLVGIAEPGTTDRGPVESILRDFELIGGLIDSTDAEGLATLDVILFGQNFATTEATARAIVAAVSSAGVGLLNEHWVHVVASHVESEAVCALSLARPPRYAYHEPPRCTQKLPATALRSHELLPGLKPGDRLMVSACGPVYHLMPGAEVLIEKDRVVPPELHGIAGLPAVRIPVYVIGQLGAGRVIVSATMLTTEITAALSVSPELYLTNVMTWLAEPRRRGALG